MRIKLLLGLLLQLGAVSLVAVQGQTRADAPAEIRPIHPGEAITQEISGRKVDRYGVRLEIGQYIRFTAKELGINVVVAESGPSGAAILELNRSNGTRGQESISVIADQAGTYVFQVRPFAPVAARGQYEASVTEPRGATEADRAVVVAESAFARAQQSWTRYTSRRQQTGDELQPILEQFVDAARLAGATADRKLEAESLFSCGVVSDSLHNDQKALEYYDRALSIQKELTDEAGAAATLRSIAGFYQLKDKAKALDYYSQALARYRAIGDVQGQRSVLQAASSDYGSTGDPAKELDYLNQALALPGGDTRSTARLFNRGGYLYSFLGETQKARYYWEQALQLSQSAGDLGGQASAEMILGLSYWHTGDNTKAIDYLTRAVSHERSGGNHRMEGTFLTDLGMVYSAIGEPHKSLECYKQALEIARSIGDVSLKTTALQWIQALYRQLGDYENASRYSDPAHTQKAIDQATATLARMKAEGNVQGEAATFSELASRYWENGEKQRALDASLQAGLLFEKAGNHFEEGNAHQGSAQFYSGLGDKARALEYYLKAVHVFHVNGLRGNEGPALANLAAFYQTSGDTARALKSYKEALAIYHETERRTFEADTLNSIGWLYESTGEWQLALDTYTQALDLARAILRHSMEAHLLQRISFIKQKLGNLSGALDSSRSAMDAVEAVRGSKSTYDARSLYLSTEQPVYDDNIQLLMRLDRLYPNEHYSTLALQTSERARARSLLDMLAESHADIRQGADPALLELERSLQRSLEAKSQVLERMLNGPKADSNADATKKEILGILSDYQEVEAKIRLTSPRYAALTQPRPLSASEIQREVLDDDTALIEYHLAPGNSFVWFVTRDGVYGRQLSPRQTIETAARRVYSLLASRNHREKFEEDNERAGRVAKADGEFAAASRALTNLILDPIADLLAAKTRLFIVPDGALQYIPFAALQDPRSPAGDPLVVQHEIVSGPSASTVALIRSDAANRPTAANKIAVLADPVFSENDPRVRRVKTAGKDPKQLSQSHITAKDVALRSAAESEATGRDGLMDRLPYSRKEADAIASLASKDNAMVATDFNASKAAAIDPKLGSFRYVHFATHSLLNSAHPELSGLVFSLVDLNGAEQDGFLQAHEVYNLKLPVDMVVLSACSTGLGKEISGEGIVGITRGFMYAGASRVLVSQWRVADDATAELMARMYSGILGPKKLRPLAALREAQISMWKDKRWSFPYYWAGFVMQGEWR